MVLPLVLCMETPNELRESFCCVCSLLHSQRTKEPALKMTFVAVLEVN